MAFALSAVLSCSRDGLEASRGTGRLFLRFSDEAMPVLRSHQETIDTNSFHLSVTDERGRAVYDGLYSGIPESFQLAEGTYRVTALSGEFKRPAFSAPQYGDEKYVVVKKGEDQHLLLECSQMNAGVLLKVHQSFLSAYPDGALVLNSESGSLMYSYREKRIAYFQPGTVRLLLSRGGQDKELLSRRLKARDVLEISVCASTPSPSSGGIALTVDTLRNWIHEELDIGGAVIPEPEEGMEPEDEGGSEGLKGETALNAFTVAEGIRNVGREGVWVHGFIAGGDLTSASYSSTAPFKSASNLLLAPRAGKCSRSSCIAVSLPEGKVREALNLVTHPELLGSPVAVKGNLMEPYFRLVGLKSPVDYKL